MALLLTCIRRYLRSRRRDERGDTLVEVLVAVVIIALSATAILGSLLISINSSGEHRYLANDDTLARSAIDTITQYVELPAQLSQSKFSECSSGNNAATILTSLKSGIPVSNLANTYGTGYTASISGVQCFVSSPSPVHLDPNCTSVSATGCTGNDSTGLLQVSVTVQDPSKYTVTMSTVVRNPTYESGTYSGDY